MAPQDANRPIGIDLFAGAGGLSLGFEQAGFDIAAAVEIDPVHCAVHKFNFPNSAIIPASVAHLTANDIRERAGIGDANISCVFGGAPCQGFSLIGHRALDDPRNRLVLDFVRLVDELSSDYFVFENVKGLTVGRHRAFLNEIVEAFSAVGYQVVEPWRVLNAAHFCTPQSRERLFLIGCRNGLRLPSYPEALTNISGRKLTNPKLRAGPSCWDALSDIPNADEFDELLNGDSVQSVDWGEPSKFAAELRGLSNDSSHYSYPREWDPKRLTSSARTVHTDISRRRFENTDPGSVEPISRFFKLHPDGVANTLRAGTDGARGAFTSPRPIHYSAARCVTVREMARLHGFPDWFRFNVTKWHGARQIGNAVPPPLARAVASQIISVMGVSPNRPSQSIGLGAEFLLSMDMSSASDYFGIVKPPQRRDQKSGAKKRKQIDIERQLSVVEAY